MKIMGIFKIDKDKIKEYINLATIKGGFINDELAEIELKHLIDELKSLPNEITLYRVVFLCDMNDLNKEKPGSHYVLNKYNLRDFHYTKMLYSADIKCDNYKPYIVTIKIKKNQIDYDETIKNRMLYPHEEEITVLNEGHGSKIIDIKEMTIKESRNNTIIKEQTQDNNKEIKLK